MSEALNRQRKEILSQIEMLIEELEIQKPAGNTSAALLRDALKKAYAVLSPEWNRGSAEAAVFIINRCILKTRDFDSVYAQKALLLARKMEEIGSKLIR